MNVLGALDSKVFDSKAMLSSDRKGSSSNIFSQPDQDVEFNQALQSQQTQSQSEIGSKNSIQLPAKNLPRDVEPRLTEGRFVDSSPVAKDFTRQGDESVDSLTHRLALQTFMRKMKEQLGVGPEQILAAFASLSMQELARPPEENINSLVMSLGLTDTQRPIAQQLFADMMRQTATTDMAEYLKSSGRQLSLSVATQQELQRERLAQALEQMQSQFFPKTVRPNTVLNPNAQALNEISTDDQTSAIDPNGNVADTRSAGMNFFPNTMAASVAGSTKAASTGAAGLASSARPYAAPMVAQPMSTVQDMAQGYQASSEATLMPQQQRYPEAADYWSSQSQLNSNSLQSGQSQISAASESSLPPSDNNKNFDLRALENMLKPNVTAKTADGAMLNQAQSSQAATWSSSMYAPASGLTRQNLEAVGASTLNSTHAAVTSPSETGSLSAFAPASAPMASASSDFFASSDEEGDGSSDSGRLQDFSTTMGQPTAKGMVGPNKEPFMLTAPNAQQNSANIRELVDQTQVMIHKGGGEMKVKLHPEGLGEVALKVNLEQGRVNVEMLTESNEAKRILEKGLGELKATLAAHRLDVDQIRVDTSKELSSQLSQQYDDAQRQMARQFMEQFRQDNSAWRRDFYDIPGARASKSQDEADTIQPRMDLQADRRRANARRLDLVA